MLELLSTWSQCRPLRQDAGLTFPRETTTSVIDLKRELFALTLETTEKVKQVLTVAGLLRTLLPSRFRKGPLQELPPWRFRQHRVKKITSFQTRSGSNQLRLTPW